MERQEQHTWKGNGLPHILNRATYCLNYMIRRGSVLVSNGKQFGRTTRGVLKHAYEMNGNAMALLVFRGRDEMRYMECGLVGPVHDE